MQHTASVEELDAAVPTWSPSATTPWGSMQSGAIVSTATQMVLVPMAIQQKGGSSGGAAAAAARGEQRLLGSREGPPFSHRSVLSPSSARRSVSVSTSSAPAVAAAVAPHAAAAAAAATVYSPPAVQPVLERQGYEAAVAREKAIAQAVAANVLAASMKLQEENATRLTVPSMPIAEFERVVDENSVLHSRVERLLAQLRVGKSGEEVAAIVSENDELRRRMEELVSQLCEVRSLGDVEQIFAENAALRAQLAMVAEQCKQVVPLARTAEALAAERDELVVQCTELGEQNAQLREQRMATLRASQLHLPAVEQLRVDMATLQAQAVANKNEAERLKATLQQREVQHKEELTAVRDAYFAFKERVASLQSQRAEETAARKMVADTVAQQSELTQKLKARLL